MSSIKKISLERGHVRAKITRFANRLETIGVAGIDLEIKRLQLAQWEEKLNRLNEAYHAALYKDEDDVNEAEFEAELNNCDEYNDKLLYIHQIFRQAEPERSHGPDWLCSDWPDYPMGCVSDIVCNFSQLIENTVVDVTKFPSLTSPHVVHSGTLSDTGPHEVHSRTLVLASYTLGH